MGANIVVVLQQGLWASLTGGWYFDTHQNLLSNTFHLYTWLFLLCLPLALYLTLPFTESIWGIYCLVIFGTFTIIKFINYRLHLMYDTSEMIEVKSADDDKDDDEDDDDNDNERRNDEEMGKGEEPKLTNQCEGGIFLSQNPLASETMEDIEMSLLPSVSSITEGITPSITASHYEAADKSTKLPEARASSRTRKSGRGSVGGIPPPIMCSSQISMESGDQEHPLITNLELNRELNRTDDLQQISDYLARRDVNRMSCSEAALSSVVVPSSSRRNIDNDLTASNESNAYRTHIVPDKEESRMTRSSHSGGGTVRDRQHRLRRAVRRPTRTEADGNEPRPTKQNRSSCSQATPEITPPPPTKQSIEMVTFKYTTDNSNTKQSGRYAEYDTASISSYKETSPESEVIMLPSRIKAESVDMAQASDKPGVLKIGSKRSAKSWLEMASHNDEYDDDYDDDDDDAAVVSTSLLGKRVSVEEKSMQRPSHRRLGRSTSGKIEESGILKTEDFVEKPSRFLSFRDSLEDFDKHLLAEQKLQSTRTGEVKDFRNLKPLGGALTAKSSSESSTRAIDMPTGINTSSPLSRGGGAGDAVDDGTLKSSPSHGYSVGRAGKMRASVPRLTRHSSGCEDKESRSASDRCVKDLPLNSVRLSKTIEHQQFSNDLDLCDARSRGSGISSLNSKEMVFSCPQVNQPPSIEEGVIAAESLESSAKQRQSNAKSSDAPSSKKSWKKSERKKGEGVAGGEEGREGAQNVSLIVGLRQLFATDSDSQTSGEFQSMSNSSDYSSSTLTNDEQEFPIHIVDESGEKSSEATVLKDSPYFNRNQSKFSDLQAKKSKSKQSSALSLGEMTPESKSRSEKEKNLTSAVVSEASLVSSHLGAGKSKDALSRDRVSASMKEIRDKNKDEGRISWVDGGGDAKSKKLSGGKASSKPGSGKMKNVPEARAEFMRHKRTHNIDEPNWYVDNEEIVGLDGGEGGRQADVQQKGKGAIPKQRQSTPHVARAMRTQSPVHTPSGDSSDSDDSLSFDDRLDAALQKRMKQILDKATNEELREELKYLRAKLNARMAANRRRSSEVGETPPGSSKRRADPKSKSQDGKRNLGSSIRSRLSHAEFGSSHNDEDELSPVRAESQDGDKRLKCPESKHAVNSHESLSSANQSEVSTLLSTVERRGRKATRANYDNPDLNEKCRSSQNSSTRSDALSCVALKSLLMDSQPMLAVGGASSSCSSIKAPSSRHMARSHDDTTEGAVHCFQDEHGQWMTYTFAEASSGLAVSINPVLPAAFTGRSTAKRNRNASSTDGESVRTLDSPPSAFPHSSATAASIPSPSASFFSRLPIGGRSGVIAGSAWQSTGSGPAVSLLLSSTSHTMQGETGSNNSLEGDRRPSSNAEDLEGSDSSGGRGPHRSGSRHKRHKPKHYYILSLIPSYMTSSVSESIKRVLEFKVQIDRLDLLAMLDRNNCLEMTASILLAVCVGILGCLVLSKDFFKDFWIFWVCFVMAGCQYSLLKSVQPDAASPMHGYNGIIVFSRAFYFCTCASLLLLLSYALNFVPESTKPNSVELYHIPFDMLSIILFFIEVVKGKKLNCYLRHKGHPTLKNQPQSQLVYNLFVYMLDETHLPPITGNNSDKTRVVVVVVFLCCLPLVFMLGLLPQVNTFTQYILEQIELYVFAGTATTSLVGSIFSIFRNVIVVAVLFGFCYLGIMDPMGPPEQPNTTQHVLFSMYCGALISLTYHLSRSTNDPSVLFKLINEMVHHKRCTGSEEETQTEQEQVSELTDPLPEQLKCSVRDRLISDAIVCVMSSILVFAVSVSTAFSSPVLQPYLMDTLVYLCVGFGLVVDYLLPQLRKEMPWLCCAHPVLVSKERGEFEVKAAARVMAFEKLYVWLRFIERNFLLPTVFLCALTISTRTLIENQKFSLGVTALVIVFCSLKMFRGAFTSPSHQYVIIIFTTLVFRYDLNGYSETFIIDYFFLSIIFYKMWELMLRLRFILTYIAPWQITWGSAFHAFAQPFSVPHSAMLLVQAVVSSLLSAPLNPLLGSAIFLTSYIRPIKFWEKNYNTKRVDHTNTRLAAQIDRTPGADDNNLNSIFYEHLTRSLQRSLCGDVQLGRWGTVAQGDCFIIASDYLNALVHIIELGNGFITFQLRGLEFRGTYCQQREVEAITEDVEGDEGFCCCKPGHLPHMLSANAAFSQRWLSWEVKIARYVVEGYSIADNNAASMLLVYDLRKVLITYYVKSIIYYCCRSPKLSDWLEDESLREPLQCTVSKSYVDVDPTFSSAVDEDYDPRLSGISRASFCRVYLDWIKYCASRRDKTIDAGSGSWLVTLCFALSLLGRRALGSASHHSSSVNIEFFLSGLMALFKGDLRITSVRDEWVFVDMELLRRVVAPGVRMSVKLHQDHFTSSDEYEDNVALYEAISSHEQNMVISHEADPAWRNAILSNVPSLLTLRHVCDEGTDEYKVIILNKRFLSFRVIKVNRECVRGLWAGQLQELIFLRNRNPERGSIQNAKQALRNMINSSCDQPIGYPIYVSPLTTSYVGTNEQYCSVVGKEFGIETAINALMSCFNRLRRRCSASCTSGSSVMNDDVFNQTCTGVTSPPNSSCAVLRPIPLYPRSSQSLSTGGLAPSNLSRSDSLHPHSRVSLVSVAGLGMMGKPGAAFTSIAGFIGDAGVGTSSRESIGPRIGQRVQVIDTSMMFDSINLGRRIDVTWPREDWRNNGGKSGWGQGWMPERGMEGVVVHRWKPFHRDPTCRSHIDKTIVLVQIGERFVPIMESGVTLCELDL